MQIEYIRWFDYLLFIVYALVIYLISLKVLQNIITISLRKYFNWLFFIKAIASFLYVHVYLYYYGYGDTLRFFRFGQFYKNTLFQISDLSFVDWIFMSNATFKDIVSYQIDYAYGFSESSFFINKISGFLSLFTFDSFLVNTLLFSFFSLIGLWYMFIGLYHLYPKLKKEIIFSILFIPSVVFWGSGLMKDTICIGAMGFMTYNVCKIFFIKNRHVSSIIVNAISFIICTYLISQAKVYQLLALFPGIFIWVFYSYRDRIKNNFIRVLITPILLISIIFIVVIGLQTFSANLEKYALENVVDTAIGLNYNLSKLDAGSAYDLGLIDPSLVGLIKKFPAAVNVSLFRPYLWEVSNPLMLLSALESLLILLLTLKVIMKVGFFKFPSKVLGSGIIMYCFTFSLIFGFATGLSAQNFGSLVRYKIPIMPLYLIGLFIMYYDVIGTGYLKKTRRKK